MSQHNCQISFDLDMSGKRFSYSTTFLDRIVSNNSVTFFLWGRGVGGGGGGVGGLRVRDIKQIYLQNHFTAKH